MKTYREKLLETMKSQFHITKSTSNRPSVHRRNCKLANYLHTAGGSVLELFPSKPVTAIRKFRGPYRGTSSCNSFTLMRLTRDLVQLKARCLVDTPVTVYNDTIFTLIYNGKDGGEVQFIDRSQTVVLKWVTDKLISEEDFYTSWNAVRRVRPGDGNPDKPEPVPVIVKRNLLLTTNVFS